MPKTLPKGVSVDRDRHKNIRLYYRVAGRAKVRLKERPGTKEFDAEVACARLGIPYGEPSDSHEATRRVGAPAKEGSFQWLVHQYKARAGNKVSADQLARRVRLLEDICDSQHNGKRRGDLPFALMERKHVIEIRDTLLKTPGAQNNLVKYVSSMFGWAVKSGLAARNPAAGIERLHSGEGFHTWTIDEVRQYEAKHPLGSKARLALHIGLFTGLRLANIAVLGRQHVRDGWFTFRPTKTTKSSGVTVEAPVLPVLQASIDATATGDLTFLINDLGRAFSAAGLGNKMRQWCDQAGLPQCSMHGLRKAGATIAAENGATDAQLMAIYGWTTRAQTTLYTKRAQRKRLAGEAMHLLLPEQKMDELVPPRARSKNSGAKRAKNEIKTKGI